MKTKEEIKDKIIELKEIKNRSQLNFCEDFLREIRKNIAVLEWVLDDLKSCKTCHGRGFQVGGGDSVDYGSATVRLPTYPEPCEDCTGHGLCPSCGWVIVHESEGDENFEAWWDNPTTCPNPKCGWEPTEIKNF